MRSKAPSLALLLLTTGCERNQASSAEWEVEAGTRLDGGDLVSPSILMVDDVRYRLFWGGSAVSSATSDDEGFTFSKESGTRMSHGGNAAVIRESEEVLRMYFEVSADSDKDAVRMIKTAVSMDEGSTWTEEGLVLYPEAIDNDFLSVPDAIRLPDGRVRLYYVSAGFLLRSAISDDGKAFVREQDDEAYILGSLSDHSKVAIDPCIYYDGEAYRLYYSTAWVEADESAGPTQIVSASSADGLTFSEDDRTIVDAHSLNLEHVVDPAVIELSTGQLRMFFGGETDPNHFDLYSAIAD